MGTREFAGQMKAAIQQLKSQGVASIYVDNLISYLESVEQSPDPNPSPAELERYKAELGHRIESMKQAHAAQLEHFKSVITAGQNAIRTMVLVNGGAAVAMLAFLGHLARIGSMAIPTYASCLIPFVVGTLLGALVSGATYLAQWLFGSESCAVRRVGMGVNIVAIVLGFASFVSFGVGAFWTYDAFLSAPPIANPAFVGAIHLEGTE